MSFQKKFRSISVATRFQSGASALLLLFAAVLLPGRNLWADAPTVTAVLTSSETEVDRPVQLQIKVTDDANAIPPNEITVDGLDIRYTGQSQLVEGRNLHDSGPCRTNEERHPAHSRPHPERLA